VSKIGIEHAGAASHITACGDQERGKSTVSFTIYITPCKQSGTGADDRFCPPIQGRPKKREGKAGKRGQPAGV
jgi:hypothetical protein